MFTQITKKTIGSILILLACTVFMPAHVVLAECFVAPDALWKLEEDGSADGALYLDSSGNGLNSEAETGVVCPSCSWPTQNTVDSIVGYGQDFDGSDGIDFNASGTTPGVTAFDWALGDDFTIELWMKRAVDPTPPLSEREVLIGRDDSHYVGESDMSWWIGLETDGTVLTRFRDMNGVGTDGHLQSPNSVIDDEWHHIVFVRTAGPQPGVLPGENRLYIDGKLMASAAVVYTAGFNPSAADLNIGYLNLGDPTDWFEFGKNEGGSIDEIALYSSALTSDVINQHHINGLYGAGYCDSLAPTITSFPEPDTETLVTASAIGYSFVYDVNAAANPLPAYALDLKPDTDMTINANSGVITWTPNTLQLGNQNTTVSATNDSDSDTQSFVIDVMDVCTTGMIAYWKLEEIGGPYADESVNGLDSESPPNPECSACTSPALNDMIDDTDNIVMNAQNFDGTDGIDIPASGNNPGNLPFDWAVAEDFSIELWVKTTNIASPSLGEREIFIGRNDLTSSLHWWVGLDTDGKVIIRLRDTLGTGSDGNLASSNSIMDGEWHHVVLVREAGTPGENRLYIDGKLEDFAAVTYTAGFDSQNAQITIGYLNGGGEPFYEFGQTGGGSLDEIALYNIALTGDIVRQHYSQVRDRGYCNTPPAITSDITVAPGVVATENVTFNYTAVGSDTNGDTLSWSLQNAPSGMSLAPSSGPAVTLSWTPDNVSSSGAVTLVLEDGYGGVDTEVFTISVVDVNDPPIITTTASTVATTGILYTYNPAATDSDLPPDTLSWSLTNAPDGMTIVGTTGVISWTPGNGVLSSGSVTLTVSDGRGGSDTELFTITVNTSNSAPEITTVAGTTVNLGATYVYNPLATDPDGDTLTWNLENAPDEMTFDASTGAISWTPATVVDDVTITLSVNDGNGAFDTEEITITVSEGGDTTDNGGGGGGGIGCFIDSLKADL